nr:hypothetical protein [uncultured Holophaga sp.]
MGRESAPVTCRNCVILVVRAGYLRRWWFPFLREPLILGMRILGVVHGIDAYRQEVRNPECKGCVRFLKAELEEKSPLFRFLNKLIGKRFNRLRDSLATQEELDRAKQVARERMGGE